MPASSPFNLAFTSRSASLGVALGALFSLAATACGSSDDGYSPAHFGAPCVDEDGDGFGNGCGAGLDCDDASLAATDECYRCLDHAEGCPCDVEGEREACGVVSVRTEESIVCGLGERVCAGGAWAECVVNNASTIPVPEEPAMLPTDLGSASPCTNNPCAVGCQEFVDDPNGLPSNGSIQAQGGNLGLVPNGLPPPPPICFGGQQGTCSHSVCTAGSALPSGCDITQPPAPVPVELWSEGFANNLAGWTLGSEWAVGPTKTSTGHNLGNPDPTYDYSPTGDNGVAGVVLGGNAVTTAHAASYLTSPSVDVSAVPGVLTLSYAEHYNFAGTPTATATVEVWNGAGWIVVESLSSTVTDASWRTVTRDVTAYKNAAFKVRFGYTVLKKTNTKVSALNVDEVKLTTLAAAVLPSSSCVQTICAADPSCCNGSWGAACVAKVPTVCGMDCANVAGTCALCYKDASDHDGDGYSFAEGDCLDCDVAVNPGAYDFPGNGRDEDCSGVADDATANCDAGLSMTSSVALEHAKAIGLCQTSKETSVGKKRTWGVLSSALVQADGVSAPHASSYGILSSFGQSNLPREGSKLVAYSTGTARAPSDPGYVNPNGQYGSFDQKLSCPFPAGFPKNSVSCPNAPAGSSAYDSSGLWLKIRVPTNALSLSFKFSYFSSEFPEWVCSNYNDSFVALLSTGYQPANSPANSGNISFDSKGNPVSVNVGFFTVTGGSVLAGTGFDGTCQGNVCGGGTDWLQTTSPVVPGETITLHFATWDTGDHVWDSTVLIDDFQWSEKPATIQTFVPQPPGGNLYNTASFTRDYDVSSLCPLGTSVSWGLWSWSAQTPADSSVRFYVQTAPTAAELGAAPVDALLFSAPSGPDSLVGTATIAKAGNPDTQGGSASVEATLASAGRPLEQPFLRVTSTLLPSSDGTKTPTLQSWNQQFLCVPSE